MINRIEPTVICYFVRHGETTLNAANCFRGAMNPSLNADGRREAHQLAKYFDGMEFAAIVYSDKLRSHETAGVIASKHPSTDIFGTENLHPWDVGKFSGQPKDKANVAELETYVQNPDSPIPGGESLNEFKNRVRPCIREATEIANRVGKPVLCVVHSSVIHELGSYLNNDDHTSCLVEPGGVAAIHYDPENGVMGASAIHKAIIPPPAQRADTIS